MERQKEALEEEKLDAIEEAKEKEKMFEAKLSEERAAIALKGMCLCVCVCICVHICVYQQYVKSVWSGYISY